MSRPRSALGPPPSLDSVRVRPGPLLLGHLHDGPGLDAHEHRLGALPAPDADELVDITDRAGIRGRGGAGFPFADKLRTVLQQAGPAEVVVNAAEGEPPSHKDATLLRWAPHRVLDGAAIVARALGCRSVHVVVPVERPEVGAALAAAVAERRRRREPVRWEVHQADDGFVSGQSFAVTELIGGRPNLPVTGWAPQAVVGHRRRPTLLSNAETFAHVGAAVRLGPASYRRLGTGDEPGTTLLTLGGDGPDAEVREVPLGTPWTQVLSAAVIDRPVLLGGYHGTWVPSGGLRDRVVSRLDLQQQGWTLGAGVVLPLEPGQCLLRRTSRITTYLASQVAGRCGPCRNGLPALAEELADLAFTGLGRDAGRVGLLADLVDGRGACAHPDGTVRLVRTAVRVAHDEVLRHRRGGCLEDVAHGAGRSA